MMKIQLFIILFLLIGSNSSCKNYSFSGATIPKGVKSITISQIQNQAQNSWISSERIINQELRNKFIQDGGLNLVNENGDYEMQGYISNYNIVVEAPTQGQLSNTYRLNITLHIDFKNNISENQPTWSQDFTNYEVYVGDIAGNEDKYITSVSKQLATSVFNRVFSTW